MENNREALSKTVENNPDVLLKVDHLCQYFRLGHRTLKAVDDVSFEIRKGETFGLVGESGCGKTTTGRTIIKLNNITSGNVYFKGKRIGAGTRSYKDAIANARKEAAKKIKALRAELKYLKYEDTKRACVEEQIRKINEELGEVVDKNRALIRDNNWLADVDGSYGENDAGIFFFTPDGKYIEWTGTYLYSDIPFIVEDPVLKIIEEGTGNE